MSILERREIKHGEISEDAFEVYENQQGSSQASSVFRMVKLSLSDNHEDSGEYWCSRANRKLDNFEKSNILNAPRLRPLKLEVDNFLPFSLPMAAIEI